MIKKILLGTAVLVGGTAAALCLVAANYESKIPSSSYVGLVDVSGLTRDQAQFKVRQWWENEKLRELEFSLPDDASKKISGKPSQLGLVVDDVASVSQIPLQDFWQNAKSAVARDASRREYEVKFKQLEGNFDKIATFVEQSVGDHEPARIKFSGGGIQRIPEKTGRELDEGKMPTVVLSALKGDGTEVLPIREAKKKVSDEDLNAITDVVSEYTTRFSTSKATRSSNIRLAASKIDGLVLAPGESFSFNKVVGRRTAKAGFKVAGVYKNGKHDIDIGGGICQVSSTLYNAVLFANLKVKNRQNHSMPVPYVPIGRDATVDYGSVDFVFQNNYEHPIAINTEVNGGSITFRLLGQKKPSLQVKLVSSDARSWATGEKTVPDPTLPAGKKKVVEKGSAGHSVNTYRVVYENGVEVKREPLGRSYYRGATRIVAVGSKPAATPPVIDPVETDPEIPPATIDGDVL